VKDVLFPQPSRSSCNGSTRIFVHIDYQTNEGLGSALRKPKPRDFKHIALTIAGTNPNKSPAL